MKKITKIESDLIIAAINEARKYKLDTIQLIDLYLKNKHKIFENNDLEQDYSDFVENITTDKFPRFKDSLNLFESTIDKLLINNQTNTLPS